MTARTLMVQGTASSVGKSLLVTALCRIFAQAGLRVAPFKAQNMALNSAVTPEGLEIGRAQAVQAEAAGVPSQVDMNPILLKPEGDRRSQIVVLGRPIGSMTAAQYHDHKPRLAETIAASLTRLRSTHDIVVIEGAGSPAEVNLKARDIVNMHVARVADAPVLMAGDIDRGGVFAAFVGTLELLDPDERRRIAAFVVNKFRGDISLLQPGLDVLVRRTGKPVLGVIPYVHRLRVADEDSVSLDHRATRGRPSNGDIDIAIVRLPRISNYDDFEPLEHEAGVVVRFVEHPEQLAGADLVILPGSKSTVSDLAWLRQSGIADVLGARARDRAPVLGVCGGCQMLGQVIEDPHAIESSEPSVNGLGLLPLVTRFGRDKVTAQLRARAKHPSFLTDGAVLVEDIAGYQIHMGVVEPTMHSARPFELTLRNGRADSVLDGAIAPSGAVVGTMIHGLFESTELRAATLAFLRKRRGLAPSGTSVPIAGKEAEYDRLARTVRENIDSDLLWSIAGVRPVGCR